MMRTVISIVLASLLLAGCSTLSPQTEQPPAASNKEAAWQTQQSYLKALKEWRLNGRLGITTPAESHSATVNWSQQRQQYRIYLTGPLGQSLAELAGQPHAVTLKVPGREPVKASSPDLLLAQALNWQLPVSNLQYWILGLPAPKSGVAITLNEQGLLQQLYQDNWLIDYASYGMFNGHPMPTKIIATYPARNLKLTLLIRQWTTQS